MTRVFTPEHRAKLSRSHLGKKWPLGRKANSRESRLKQSATLQAKCEKTREPTNTDIAWAAGIYEGEGSVCSKQSGKTSRVVYAVVDQKDPELLERLKNLFGGRIQKAAKGSHRWTTAGPRARGFLNYILYQLTARRQDQILQAYKKEAYRG